MYSIEFVESAEKDFKQLTKEDQMRIVSVLDRILVRPHSFAMRLSGTRSYRVRVGKLRVILDILDDSKKIVILKIGHRDSVYLP